MTPGEGHARVGRIVAVASGKGGVGKSTLAVNLALALAARGERVGIVDADLHGPSIPGLMGVPAGEAPMMDPAGRIVPVRRHGIALVSMGMLAGDDEPAVLRGPMVTKHLRQFVADVDWGPLDWLILDLPPGTGDVQLTLAQSFALAGAIIVTTPQEAAARIARRGARMFQQVNVPILGVVETMSGFACPDCGRAGGPFPQGGGARLAEALGAPLLGAIPLDPAVAAGGDAGAPVALSDPEGAAGRALRAVAERLAGARPAVRSAIPLPFAFDWGPGAGAGAADAAPRPGGDPATPLRVEASGPREMAVLWADGGRSRIDARALRLACRCALCVEEVTGRVLLDPAAVPAAVSFVRVESVGAYALAVRFTDGHRTGVYDWARLRALCPPG